MYNGRAPEQYVPASHWTCTTSCKWLKEGMCDKAFGHIKTRQISVHAHLSSDKTNRNFDCSAVSRLQQAATRCEIFVGTHLDVQRPISQFRATDARSLVFLAICEAMRNVLIASTTELCTFRLQESWQSSGSSWQFANTIIE